MNKKILLAFISMILISRSLIAMDKKPANPFAAAARDVWTGFRHCIEILASSQSCYLQDPDSVVTFREQESEPKNSRLPDLHPSVTQEQESESKNSQLPDFHENVYLVELKQNDTRRHAKTIKSASVDSVSMAILVNTPITSPRQGKVFTLESAPTKSVPKNSSWVEIEQDDVHVVSQQKN
ncbi:hypothetical protein KAZ82_00305 [Candidatus Babeliales bacterium]|nr:hypothetical protein [Candidatus Babeliales bacterium]